MRNLKISLLVTLKRFAAKEAFAKALGIGISKGLSFNEIEINNNNSGKPFLELKKKSYRIVKMIIKKNLKSIYLYQMKKIMP